jgi:hypothetical protein
MKTPSPLRRGFLLFWGLWYAVVFTTNLTDLMVEWGQLPADFAWVSNNHRMMLGAIPLQGAAGLVAEGVYIGGWLWQGLACLLFLRALMARGEAFIAACRQAFVVSISLWCVFLLGAELTLNHGANVLYFQIFLAHVVSMLAVELLPRS